MSKFIWSNKKKDNLTFLKKIRPNVKHKMKFKEKKERKKNIKVNVEHWPKLDIHETFDLWP